MNICILSNFGGNNDEGQKNVAVKIADALRAKHNVLHLNAKRSIRTHEGWKDLIAFKPEIIHIFLRPSLTTFIFGRTLKIRLPYAKLLISAVQPPKNVLPLSTIGRLFKPDLLVTLSKQTERLFQEFGCKTRVMAVGVDTDRFSPVPGERKRELRKKFRMPDEKLVALHVGHITAGRNLEDVISLQDLDGLQVVVVGSPLFEHDSKILEKMSSRGCLVYREFLPNIEQMYQAADLYIFPTVDRSYCIEAPLSVLEAMATNIPVVTTQFGALTEYFSEGEGLFYVADPSQISGKVTAFMKTAGLKVETRRKVVDCTWDVAAECIERVYDELVN